MKIPELNSCRMCPRNCGINRYEQTGYCRSGYQIKINTWQKHYGEEPCISGHCGSGTIFLAGCNLNCVFCQNYSISQYDNGKEYDIDHVCRIMLELQEKGVHNINLVSPTHFSLQLREAVISAKDQGLKIPVIWNTNSYEKVETLMKLEGIVDIYLADFKYGLDSNSQMYSKVDNYFEIATQTIKEMFRQKGHISFDDNGIAKKGLMIRILVLPEDINSTQILLKWLYNNIGTDVYLSLMSQYYPTFHADRYPEISRFLTKEEYDQAVQTAEYYGFDNCLIQELRPSSYWTPDFNSFDK